jgi:hypothetical protein
MNTANLAPGDIPVAAPAQRLAVLELFGQKRIAGAFREVLHGGTPFLRIAVPTVAYDDEAGACIVIPAHDLDVRPTNVYCIDWVTGEVAHEVAHLVRHRPAWQQDPKPLRVPAAAAAAPSAA